MKTASKKTIALTDIAAKAGVNPKTARARLRALPSKERPKTSGDGWEYELACECRAGYRCALVLPVLRDVRGGAERCRPFR